MSRARAVGALLGLWTIVGLGVGTAEWLTVSRAAGWTWAVAVRAPLTAALLWVPLTLTAIAAARRWPIVPVTLRTAATHLLLAVAASFALNVVFSLVFLIAGWAAGSPTAVAWDGLAAALRFLHLNAGAWLAIAVIATLVHERQRTRAAPSPRVPVTTLAVRNGNETIVLPVAEVDWIEGAGDYARLHVGDRQYLLNDRLKRLERRLEPDTFARVHRSAIVNLSRVRQLRHRSHGDYDAVLENGTEIRVSRSYRRALAHLLERPAPE